MNLGFKEENFIYYSNKITPDFPGGIVWQADLESTGIDSLASDKHTHVIMSENLAATIQEDDYYQY